eukprot:scaffold5483_cov70-Skeletonema_dohrnii-CCMP3373.AAC.2
MLHLVAAGMMCWNIVWMRLNVLTVVIYCCVLRQALRDSLLGIITPPAVLLSSTTGIDRVVTIAARSSWFLCGFGLFLFVDSMGCGLGAVGCFLLSREAFGSKCRFTDLKYVKLSSNNWRHLEPLSAHKL